MRTSMSYVGAQGMGELDCAPAIWGLADNTQLGLCAVLSAQGHHGRVRPTVAHRVDQRLLHDPIGGQRDTSRHSG